MPYAFLTSTISAAGPAHLILFDLITLIAFCEAYKLRIRSSLTPTSLAACCSDLKTKWQCAEHVSLGCHMSIHAVYDSLSASSCCNSRRLCDRSRPPCTPTPIGHRYRSLLQDTITVFLFSHFETLLKSANQYIHAQRRGQMVNISASDL
jgi:hypothetical protein